MLSLDINTFILIIHSLVVCCIAYTAQWKHSFNIKLVVFNFHVHLAGLRPRVSLKMINVPVSLRNYVHILESCVYFHLPTVFGAKYYTFQSYIYQTRDYSRELLCTFPPTSKCKNCSGSYC